MDKAIGWVWDFIYKDCQKSTAKNDKDENTLVLMEIHNPVEFWKGPVYMFLYLLVWLYDTTLPVTKWWSLESYNCMEMIFKNHNLELYLLVFF